MPVMDEFKKEREAIKHAPLEKRLEYFRDYYLGKTLLILVVVGLLGAWLISVITAKEPALYITLVNFTELQESSEGLTAPFANDHINQRKEEIILENSSYISSDMNEVNFIKYGYEDEQRLFAMVMTGEIDLFITGEDVIERYAESEWFDDMRTFLPEEDLKRYESEDRILEYKGVPIAVKVDDSAILKEYFYYNGRQDVEVYAGFPAGSTQRRLAEEFVQYLLDTPAAEK